MKITHSVCWQRWRRGAAAVLLFTALSLGLRGQDKDTGASLIKEFFSAERAREILKAVEVAGDLQRLSADPLQIKIGGAFSENLVPGSNLNLEREPKELSKLNLNSSVSKGFYPNELTFITDSNFQLEDGAVKENVTKLLLNYEYFLRQWLEGYLFVERFSDSYLSIQQRYEIGTGIKLEAEIPFLFMKEGGEDLFRQCDLILRSAVADLRGRENSSYSPKLLERMKQSLAGMKKNETDLELAKEMEDMMALVEARLAPAGPEGPASEGGLDLKLMGLIVKLKGANPKDDRSDILQKWLEEKTLALARLREAEAYLEGKESILSASNVKEAKVSWRKKNAVLGLGLAFSLFSEIEKAEIAQEILDGAWETVTLPATHRLRWVVRPSFEFHPVKAIALKGQFYFKEYLWGPKGKNHRPNTRRDYYLKLDYELPAALGWAKSLTFFIAYEFHYDSLPPRIPEDTLADLAVRYGIAPENINPSADKEHHVLNLGVEIKF
jgi:hypothetical protein